MKLLQVLDTSGTVRTSENLDLSTDQILNAYRNMLFTRVLDEKMIALQRQGRMGTYVSCSGQEASQIGTTLALKKDDWIFPMYRDLGVVVQREVPLDSVLNRLFGNSLDPGLGRDLPNTFGWKEQKIFTLAAPIASHLLPAVGFAMAARYRGEDLVTLSLFGDGATSSGEFHVAMNFAGVYRTGTVFVCENNQYAISVPVSRQTASENIAVKAEAYGFEGRIVDGNDLFAVYKAVRDAVENARKGEGPTLVECLTYRLGAHSTSDDWKKYRTNAEVDEWKEKDPLARLKLFLEKKGVWKDEEDSRLRKEFESKIAEAVSIAERVFPPGVDTMFDGVYSKQPWNLEEQSSDFE